MTVDDILRNIGMFLIISDIHTYKVNYDDVATATSST